jgi:uncharacterized protein
MDAGYFTGFRELASQLVPHIAADGDGAHDLSHIARVWESAMSLCAEEGGDAEIIAAAVLLHDCVHVPKNSPERASASRLAAEKARVVLTELGWAADRTGHVGSAIESHSYSGGVTPVTLEACILQDADRLDAIGMVGIARCFYTAGRMGSELYEASDPGGEARELDDARYALDHFPKKLLRVSSGFRTAAGARMARERHAEVERFYRGLLREIGHGGDA